MNDRVLLKIENGIATVTLNRADRHNGMDMLMVRAIVKTQQQLKKNREVRAAILCGDGPSFCAGLDVKALLDNPLTTAVGYATLYLPRRNIFQTWGMGWRELPFPVIAAIHGNCFGAGIQLALGADIRIATPDAKISIMQSKWGLVPDMGGTALLRELLPLDVVKELTFTGRILSGTQAKALGLVTHLAEDPLAQARSLIAEMLIRSPDAIAAGKFLLQEAWNTDENGALAEERRRQRQVMGGKNQRIAVERNLKKSEKPYMRTTVRR
mgnify:CR=1 FL=1